MKKLSVCMLTLSVASIISIVLVGCQGKVDARFSGYQEVADLATETCYYHNVAEIRNDGTDYLFGLVNVGYKKVWFEYRGSVDLGIDVSKVSIDGPDEKGIVTIAIPPAQVIGTPKVDDTSFSELYSDTGLITPITLVDQTEAYKSAQSEMRAQAENDASLLLRARERAKTLLGQYVKNVGEAQGETYEIKFIDAE